MNSEQGTGTEGSSLPSYCVKQTQNLQSRNGASCSCPPLRSLAKLQHKKNPTVDFFRRASTARGASRRWWRPTSTTASCGRPRDTGSTTARTCSPSRWRRRPSPSNQWTARVTGEASTPFESCLTLGSGGDLIKRIASVQDAVIIH